MGLNVAVIGLGASGFAAARLAVSKGGDVYVSDTRTDDAVAARGAALRTDGVAVELGGHDLERLVDAGLVVASPGIPPDAPVLRALAERGVEWVSEPEFASRFLTGSLIAVTGTNGKTTTTLLIEHLLRASGIAARAGGNVGGGLAPAASELGLLDPGPDWVVLEMSSFQLAGVSSFRPDIGVVTNLSPDHLDRYPDVEAYYADKARLFETADEDSVWVLPTGDPSVTALAGDAPGSRFGFGSDGGDHAFVADGCLHLAVGGDLEPVLDLTEFPLIGRHNVENALAAALTARLAGAQTGGISAGLGSAKALPHRMEPVRERMGVLWVNDSKATNLAATRGALTSMERPVVLLLGGKDKGESFADLWPSARGRVRAILAYGAAGSRAVMELERAMTADFAGGAAPANQGDPQAETLIELLAADLAEVVGRAAEVARPGDAVLLSPGCSSFDMFESYEHRGRAFVEQVRGLS